MSHLTANDLKVRGIAAIESALADQAEATISVRGKERFVVMEMAQYHYRQAIEIHPGSALLYCHYAMALVRSQPDLAGKKCLLMRGGECGHGWEFRRRTAAPAIMWPWRCRRSSARKKSSLGMRSPRSAVPSF